MATLQDKNHMEELASAVTRGACEGALHMRLLADRLRRWRGYDCCRVVQPLAICDQV